jgi:hypothetical protein
MNDPRAAQVELVDSAAPAQQAAYTEVIPAATTTQGTGGASNGQELGGDITGAQRVQEI